MGREVSSIWLKHNIDAEKAITRNTPNSETFITICKNIAGYIIPGKEDSHSLLKK